MGAQEWRNNIRADDRRRRRFTAKPGAQAGSCLAVAEEAQGTDVVEIALSAALGYGKDVVRVPKATAAIDRLHAVKAKPSLSSCASGSLESCVGGNRIDLAGGAMAAIASEDLVTDISGVGAQTPLMHAVVAAEGAATLCQDLELAPPAQGTAVRPCRQVGVANVSAGKCARKKHGLITRIGSGFEVDLDRFDEGHQPSQQLLVNGVVVVSRKDLAIRELHYTAKSVALGTRRKVVANENLGQPRYLPLKCLYLSHGAILLSFIYVGLPAKQKCMDYHARSLTRSA